MPRYSVINYYSGDEVAKFNTEADLVHAVFNTNEFWFPIEIRDLDKNRRISQNELMELKEDICHDR